jgi:hypothetical protein
MKNWSAAVIAALMISKCSSFKVATSVSNTIKMAPVKIDMDQAQEAAPLPATPIMPLQGDNIIAPVNDINPSLNLVDSQRQHHQHHHHQHGSNLGANTSVM